MLKKQIILSYAIQVIFSFAALVTTLLSYFDKIWLDATLWLIALSFITIAFNYYSIKNYKLMALFYFVMGLLIIILKLIKVL